MSGLFGKIKDFVGLNDPADYEYEYEEVEGDEYQSLYEEENTEPEALVPPMPIEEAERPARRRIRERVLSTESGMVSMNNVIGMPGAMNGMSEVMVMEPRTFEEMPQAIQALRERKSVVLNLTIMDPDQAQRAVDFVAGGTYAMDGHQERIGESIFLFTPNCVQVSMPSESEDGFIDQEPVNGPSQAAPTPAWATEQIARMA
ncbi:cell division protein SepF [cf. Phormidesmis sp. LEGE 11477]|uniref:cell division protein SepF n=1 Tax=cf. Phormidesmis sp. LEGE 11477 TaxID=1828680 RepID=UPI00187F975C|nr:cell division protein SepF [cf. Phormidesmis sp. LEGE 11477]MBE9060142.1 cell division protein SepF [cf. Phormidesmis sp. LEGE 11477]